MAQRLWIRLAAPLVLALCGCVRSDGPLALHSFDPDDGPPDPAFWQRAAEVKAGEKARHASVWLLPFWSSDREVQLGADGNDVRSRGWSVFNLGLGLTPLLPLYFSIRDHRWDREGDGAHCSLTWTPLWATGSSEGDCGAMLDASGVPLFYGRLHIVAPDVGLTTDVWHYLWSIGPLMADSKLDRPGLTATSRVFVPLELIGFGTLLWTSRTTESAAGRMLQHGPIGGWLGYVESDGERVGNLIDDEVERVLHPDAEAPPPMPPVPGPYRPHLRLMLGGILWSGFYDTDESGAEVTGRHGPLWTMFGYGTKDGRSRVLVFWIPIPT